MWAGQEKHVGLIGGEGVLLLLLAEGRAVDNSESAWI